MPTAEQRKRLKATVAAMPKCPTCGGFAIPSAQKPGAFVCKEHGRFVPGRAS